MPAAAAVGAAAMAFFVPQVACAAAAAWTQHNADLVWTDDPGAWHQQLARIVDHRFTTLDELETFADDSKRAGVSALMLVQVQKTRSCPGGWYNGLQLCDHINGSCNDAQLKPLLEKHPCL